MKIILLFTFLLSFSVSANEIDWLQVKKIYKNYVASPTDNNAKRVLELLPENYTKLESKEFSEASEYIYNYAQYQVLEKQVISGHHYSARIAFRLRAIAGGGFLEELYITLGELIRVNPEVFLSELLLAKPAVSQMDNFLNLGEKFVDREKASCNEVKLRKESLNKVINPKYNKIKSKILFHFNKELSSESCTQYNNTP